MSRGRPYCHQDDLAIIEAFTPRAQRIEAVARNLGRTPAAVTRRYYRLPRSVRRARFEWDGRPRPSDRHAMTDRTVLVRRLGRIWKLADDVQAKLKTVQQHLSADAVQDASSAIADAQELAKRIEDEADTTVADPMAT